MIIAAQQTNVNPIQASRDQTAAITDYSERENTWVDTNARNIETMASMQRTNEYQVCTIALLAHCTHGSQTTNLLLFSLLLSSHLPETNVGAYAECSAAVDFSRG